ncbi:hypothetical protein [Shewanella sp. OMA3-2]|nr:hypothetical protein [Shewanella sp. OMA3-2]UJF23461.1 hypothetical protein L0B17_04805 [Shewanella sp. OMA3-2]
MARELDITDDTVQVPVKHLLHNND